MGCVCSLLLQLLVLRFVVAISNRDFKFFLVLVFFFDLGLPFELPLKEAMSLVALPAETHCYYWRPVSMVIGYLCLIKFQIGVHNEPVYLAFTNMSIPLLEAEIFPLPSILFPSCSRYLSVFSFSSVFLRLPALQNAFKKKSKLK